MTQILQRAQTTAERVRDMAVSQIAAEIERLERERNEARAEVAWLTAQRDEAQRIIGIYNTSRDEVIAQLCEMNDALRAERDEARADVERLRPAAEAWEAWREYDELVSSMPFTRDTDQEQAVQDAATKRSEAYARAREAAKESQP